LKDEIAKVTEEHSKDKHKISELEFESAVITKENRELKRQVLLISEMKANNTLR